MRRAWQPTPVFLPGESHGPRAWWATVSGVTKSQTRVSGQAHSTHVYIYDTSVEKTVDFNACAFFFFFNIFIYLTAPGLSVACGIYFPDQGSNLGSLLWEHGVIATGQPGKSLMHVL